MRKSSFEFCFRLRKSFSHWAVVLLPHPSLTEELHRKSFLSQPHMNYYYKSVPYCQVFFLADHRGIEPLLSDLESDVLPLTLMACGRDDRARTCDLMLPKHVRYQLRYIPSSLSGTRNYLWSDFRQSTLHHYSGEISLPYRSWDST